MASSQTGSSASYLCWTLDVGRSALATPKLSAYAGSTFFFRHGRVAESGLRHSTRNRAWGNPPWVRIPPLPLALRKEHLAKESALFRQDWHVATSSSYGHLELAHWKKSQVHPVCSTAASSLHLFSYEHTFSVFCSSVFDFIRPDFNHRRLRTEIP